MTFAFYARQTEANHPKYLEQLLTLAQIENFKVCVYKPYLQYLNNTFAKCFDLPTFSTSEELKEKQTDVLISLGGDGTLLETLQFIKQSGIPVIGVNTGRLGFLAVVSKDEFMKYIMLAIKEKYTLDKRDVLELIYPHPSLAQNHYALNEISIYKKETSTLIHLDTFIDGEFLNSYFADGLIISTPTGSTAYSLSCGGPIMLPDSDNFIITPIAPHNLNVRPIVVPNNRKIKIKVKCRSEHFNVSLDSNMIELPNNAEFELVKTNFTFNLMRFEEPHFFQTLRNKLLLGVDNRSL